MHKFTKKDLGYSIVTGFVTGFIAWQVFDFLRIPQFYGISFALLLIVIPITWIIGVNLGYFLGRWIGFFNQFGRFAAIGFTNTAVDLGVLNLLIAWTGIAAGYYYAVFKGVSFVIAMLHSYFWNKIWVFEAVNTSNERTEFTEFTKFFTVTLLSALINIFTAYFVVNFVHPVFGLDPNSWANIGAVVGSATALIFSFVGFKRAVFKK